jgi:hypothetical protein
MFATLLELDVLSQVRATMEELFSIRIETHRSAETAADAQNQLNNLKLREQDFIQRYGV